MTRGLDLRIYLDKENERGVLAFKLGPQSSTLWPVDQKVVVLGSFHLGVQALLSVPLNSHRFENIQSYGSFYYRPYVYNYIIIFI